MELYHRTYGDASRPSLTILHGLLGAGGNWHTLSRGPFAEVRHVIVPDLRNHGQSPHDSRMDIEAMGLDVLELWDALGLDGGALMGHSMGGKVAMQIALTHPERVEKLIVVDIAPRAYQPGHDAIFSALAKAQPQDAATRQEVEERMKGDVPNAGVRQFLLKNLRRTSDGRYEWMMALETIESNYDRIAQGLTAFGQYEGPTLFLRGANSGYILDDDWDLMTTYFPRAELVTIPDAGHWVHAEQPELLSRTIVEFLAQ